LIGNEQTQFRVRAPRGFLFSALAVLALGGCGDESQIPWLGQATQGRGVREGQAYKAKPTSYFPSNSGVEGGFKDRGGLRLYTLQQYLRGKAPYVSVAMDATILPYGTRISIPEMNQMYGREIEFRVVDTGSAFRGRAMGRIDICVESPSHFHTSYPKGLLTLVVMDSPTSAEAFKTYVRRYTEEEKKIRTKG